MDKSNSRRLDASLGALIAAAGEVAFEFSDNDQEAYKLAQVALIEIIKKTNQPADLDQEFAELAPFSQLLH